MDSLIDGAPIQPGVDNIYHQFKVTFPPDSKTLSAPDFITRSRLIGKHHRLEWSRCYHRFGRGRYYHGLEGIDITAGSHRSRYYHRFEV